MLHGFSKANYMHCLCAALRGVVYRHKEKRKIYIRNQRPNSNMEMLQQLLACVLSTFLALTPVVALAQPGNELIAYNTTIEVKNGKLTEERSFLIQVNNKASDWIADIAIHYSKGEEPQLLEAHILNTEGKVVRTLKKKEIITRSAIEYGTFFSDSFVKEFSLKWNEYPYQVKYSYTKEVKEFIYVAKWFPIINTGVPTRKATLSITLPLSYAVTTDFSGPFLYSTNTFENSRSLRWEISNLAPVQEEAFAVPFYERHPQVTVVPQSFTYGISGSFGSWATYGAWQAEMNRGLDELPPSEKVVVDKLIEGLSDQKEIIRRLYHYLQDHTRYINVAIDLGGLKPYPASYVSANKYGDCKALTIYMKALLKYAGIESYYTKVYAGANPVAINPAVPSQQFNHVILCVPLAGDTLWLENTASYLPFNYLGTFTQNRHALLVGSDSRLLKTPALALEDVLEQTQSTYTLNQAGEGQLEIQQQLKGEAFESFRHLQHEYSEKDQLRAVEERLPVKNYELLSWKMSQPERDLPHMQLQLHVSVRNLLRNVGSSLAATPASLEVPQLEAVNRRKGAVRIHVPVNKQDSTIYKLPFIAQYTTNLPHNVCIETRYGRYLEHYAQRGDQILVSRYFQLYSGNYDREEYAAFYSFVEAVKNAQKKSVIVLNPN